MFLYVYQPLVAIENDLSDDAVDTLSRYRDTIGKVMGRGLGMVPHNETVAYIERENVGTEFVIDFADRTLGGSVDDVYDILVDVHAVHR